MRHILIYFVVFLVGAIFASAVHAQQAQCAPTAQVLDALVNKYGEQQITHGATPSGAIIQVWANAETGTWSAIVHRPDGVSCLVASGDSFEFSAPGDPA